MQFMDAPRNQPCCGPARSTVRRCWPPLLHGSLLSGAHRSHTNGPFARCCRPFGVHATTTCYLYCMALPGTQFMYDFLVCKSYLPEAEHFENFCTVYLLPISNPAYVRMALRGPPFPSFVSCRLRRTSAADSGG